MHRNIYGLHAPIRQLMERKIVSHVGLELLPLAIMDSSRIFAVQNPHMPAMPQSNIHLDILEGRDETLDVTDFFRMSFSMCIPSTAYSLPACRRRCRRSHGYTCGYGAKAADVMSHRLTHTPCVAEYSIRW